MSKLDGFFRKKLDEATHEPRPEAWTKLEANLSKKNKSLNGWKIAATIALTGMLITSITWLQNKDDQQQLSEKMNSEIPSGKDNKQEPVVTHPSSSTENKSVAHNNFRKKVHQPLQMTTVPIPQEKAEREPDSIVAYPGEPIVLEKETVAAVAPEKPIVIEYTLESIPFKKKSVDVAETGEKKNNLQKALDFAREAKNSDSPLGELRQAKDDLFALNFIKDKQKKQ